MCQVCVSEGRYSQEELDRRVLAGDLTVLPIGDLPSDAAIEMLAAWCADGVIPFNVAKAVVEHLAERDFREMQARGETP